MTTIPPHAENVLRAIVLGTRTVFETPDLKVLRPLQTLGLIEYVPGPHRPGATRTLCSGRTVTAFIPTFEAKPTKAGSTFSFRTVH